MISNFLLRTLDKLRHSRSGVSNFVDVVLFVLILKFLSDKNRIVIESNFGDLKLLIQEVSNISEIDYQSSDINYEELKSIIQSGLYELEDLGIKWSEKDVETIFDDLHNFLITKLGLEADVVTPKSVVTLLTRIVKDFRPKSIYDPFARSGNVLQAFDKRFPKATKEGLIYGRQNYLIARTQSFMTSTTSIHLNFSRDDQQDSKYDIVVTNPPFGQSGIRDRHSSVGNWTDNFLNSQLEISYLVQALNKLSDRGFASIVLPMNVLSGQSVYYELRKELIQRNLLESVIILPGKLFYSTAIAPVIFNIDKQKKGNSVLLLDCSTMGSKGSINELSDDEIEGITKNLNDFRSGTLDSNDNSTFKVISSEELKSKGFDLRISSFRKLYEVPILRNAKEIGRECEALELALRQAEVKLKTLRDGL